MSEDFKTPMMLQQFTLQLSRSESAVLNDEMFNFIKSLNQSDQTRLNAILRCMTSECIDPDTIDATMWKNGILYVTPCNPLNKEKNVSVYNRAMLIVYFNSDGKVDLDITNGVDDMNYLLKRIKYLAYNPYSIRNFLPKYYYPKKLGRQSIIRKVAKTLPLGATYTDLYERYNQYIEMGKNDRKFYEAYPELWNLTYTFVNTKLNPDYRVSLLKKLEERGCDQFSQAYQQYLEVNSSSIKYKEITLDSNPEEWIIRTYSPEISRETDNYNKKTFDFVRVNMLLLARFKDIPNRMDILKAHLDKLADKALHIIKESKEYQKYEVPVSYLILDSISLKEDSMLTLLFALPRE